jgi:hypothetical protein
MSQYHSGGDVEGITWGGRYLEVEKLQLVAKSQSAQGLDDVT